MKTLVFNSKGGCGKSLVAREIIAAPNAKNIAIIEIDELNKTQLPYNSKFKAVVELKKEEIRELLIHLNEFENCVVDVGTNNLTDTIQTMIDYMLFDDIDQVVIPLGLGRSDSENALKTYKALSQYCDNIKFAFTNFNHQEKFEEQYQVFFANVSKYIKNFNDDYYIKVPSSDVFLDAQNAKKLVTELAENIDHKSAAIAAKLNGDNDKFNTLMRQELHKRAAQILLDATILPAHKKLNTNNE
ncbi:TPA: hypothetical protein ACX6QG_003743 [Photobacterium damselae]